MHNLGDKCKLAENTFNDFKYSNVFNILTKRNEGKDQIEKFVETEAFSTIQKKIACSCLVYGRNFRDK